MSWTGRRPGSGDPLRHGDSGGEPVGKEDAKTHGDSGGEPVGKDDAKNEDQAPATRCVMEIVADNQLRYLNTVRSNRFDGEICLIDSFVIGFNT